MSGSTALPHWKHVILALTQPGRAAAGVQAPADGDRGGRQPQDDVQPAAALCGLH